MQHGRQFNNLGSSFYLRGDLLTTMVNAASDFEFVLELRAKDRSERLGRGRKCQAFIFMGTDRRQWYV